MIPWIIWAVLLIVFVVIEAATAQLVTIWFAVGALVTVFVAYFCPTLWWLQLLVFAVVSAVALVATRPLVKKFAKKNQKSLNFDKCIGDIAVVTETIDNVNGVGSAKVNGVVWSARSEDGTVIENGKNVQVVKIEGVKLIVKEI